MTPTGSGMAAKVTAAVAANFQAPARALAERFEATSGHTVTLAVGSTGALYAQIRNGAPFDLLLAADAERPRLLERDGVAVADSRFTYAVGTLVLWSPERGRSLGPETLTGETGRLAIANPRLAPYGRAAEETLRALGAWERLRPRIVVGQSIGQTHQFVAGGNVPLGMVALSQVIRPKGTIAGSYWRVPASLHEPIIQQAVQIADAEAAHAFLAFLRSGDARALIERYGYALP